MAKKLKEIKINSNITRGEGDIILFWELIYISIKLRENLVRDIHKALVYSY